jgi:hypothetical protein
VLRSTVSTSSPELELGVWLEEVWRQKDGLTHWPRRVHRDRIVAFKRKSHYDLINNGPIAYELQHLYAHWSRSAAEAFVHARPGVLLADVTWSYELTQRFQLPQARLYPGHLRPVRLPDGLSETDQRRLGYKQFPSIDPRALQTTALRFLPTRDRRLDMAGHRERRARADAVRRNGGATGPVRHPQHPGICGRPRRDAPRGTPRATRSKP